MLVRHHDDGPPRARRRPVNLGDQVHDFLARLAVEVSGRLIRQQDHGAVYQSARNGGALLLAAGKLRGAVAYARSKANSIARPAHAPWTFPTRGPPHALRLLPICV